MDTSDRAVVKRGSPRRRHAIEQKRRIVEETLQPGASVARVARAHEVNANQVFAWRRLYRQGLLEHRSGESARLLPVRIVERTREAAATRGARNQRAPSGLMHLEFPKGQLRIVGRVDADALRVVLEKLLG